jgi:glycosyltransferase involved in cell wall biosynthesis
LKVLVIAQYFPPDLGGAATRANNIVKGLSLNGCQVTVIVAVPHYPHGKIPEQYRWTPIKIEQDGQVKIIRTIMPPIKSQGFFKRIVLMGAFAVSALFALPWVGHIDVVWSTSWVPGFVYSKIKRAPLAFNVDDLTLEDLPSLKLIDKDSKLLLLGTLIYRLFYVKADLITPISSGYIEVINKKYSVNKNKIKLVNIGVNIDIFKPYPRNKSDSRYRVLYAGVLGLGYDFDQILLAARLCEQQGVNIEFILHGAGECLPLIKNGIEKYRLRNITLSTRVLPSRVDVAKLYSEADALILPMKDYGRPYLGIPSKLYEYQAAGKPILCCADGEPVKYIEQTKSGIAIKPGDYVGLMTAIVYLQSNPTIARQLGLNGNTYVKNQMTLKVIGSKLKCLFESLLRKPKDDIHR